MQSINNDINDDEESNPRTEPFIDIPDSSIITTNTNSKIETDNSNVKFNLFKFNYYFL